MKIVLTCPRCGEQGFVSRGEITYDWSLAHVPSHWRHLTEVTDQHGVFAPCGCPRDGEHMDHRLQRNTSVCRTTNTQLSRPRISRKHQPDPPLRHQRRHLDVVYRHGCNLELCNTSQEELASRHGLTSAARQLALPPRGEVWYSEAIAFDFRVGKGKSVSRYDRRA